MTQVTLDQATTTGNDEVKMERNIESTASYVTTSSDEEPRKRIRLAPISMLENNIVKLQPTLTMDTDDKQAMDRITYERIHTETYMHTVPVYPNTVSHMDMPGGSTASDSALQTLIWGEFQKIHTKMDKLESMLTKLLKQQQPQGCPEKPTWLPITTVTAMREFETVGEAYNDVVRYLEYLGGSNLKEAVNLCFKEAIDDSLLIRYSWHGMEPEKLCLRETKIIRAIYDAVVVNTHYQRPSKKEIEVNLVVALKSAKERIRNRTKRQAAVYTAASNRDHFWDEDEGEV